VKLAYLKIAKLQICYRSCYRVRLIRYPHHLTFGNRATGIVIMLQSTSHILRLKPASQLQNLRAESQKFERATARSSRSHINATAVKAIHTNFLALSFCALVLACILVNQSRC